jgi:hypothetical protein
MFRTSCLKKIGGFYQPEGLPWLDRSTWVLMACVAEFRYIPENLGVWRRHDAQFTQNNPDIRSTFDFIFSDNNCPVILLNNILIFKERYILLSNYSKWVRSRKIKHLLGCIQSCILSPLTAFQLVKYIKGRST